MSRRTWLGLVPLLAVGCLPVIEPLSDPDKAEPDKRLLGRWQQANSTGVTEVDQPAVEGNPKGLMRAVYDGKADDPANAFWFVTSTVGKHAYMTVFVEPVGDLKFPDFRKPGAYAEYAKRKERRYFIFRYTVDGDTFVGDGGGKTAVEKALNAAGLTTNRDGVFPTPAGWLAKYLAEKDPDAIYDGTNKQEYRRVRK